MLNKFLISKNKAVKLLDCSYNTFTTISTELEFVRIGNREKVVLQSLIDFIEKIKTKPHSVLTLNLKPISYCQSYSSNSSSKKVRINLEE